MPFAAGHIAVSHAGTELALQTIGLQRTIKVEAAIIIPGGVRTEAIAVQGAGTTAGMPDVVTGQGDEASGDQDAAVKPGDDVTPEFHAVLVHLIGAPLLVSAALFLPR